MVKTKAENSEIVTVIFTVHLFEVETVVALVFSIENCLKVTIVVKDSSQNTKIFYFSAISGESESFNFFIQIYLHIINYMLYKKKFSKKSCLV